MLQGLRQFGVGPGARGAAPGGAVLALRPPDLKIKVACYSGGRGVSCFVSQLFEGWWFELWNVWDGEGCVRKVLKGSYCSSTETKLTTFLIVDLFENDMNVDRRCIYCRLAQISTRFDGKSRVRRRLVQPSVYTLTIQIHTKKRSVGYYIANVK